MKDKEWGNLPEVLVMLLQNIQGDPFETLITLSNPVTFSLIKNYYFHDYDKDDFLQEARKVLFKAVTTYDMRYEMPFLQYYHMKLSNHLNMLVRKNHAHKRRVNLEAVSLDNLVEKAGINIQGSSSTHTYPEETAVAKETLENYLVELSPFEKNTFWLFINGETQVEIAKKLSCNIEQIRNALYRCSKKLRNLIQQ